MVLVELLLNKVDSQIRLILVKFSTLYIFVLFFQHYYFLGSIVYGVSEFGF